MSKVVGVAVLMLLMPLVVLANQHSAIIPNVLSQDAAEGEMAYIGYEVSPDNSNYIRVYQCACLSPSGCSNSNELLLGCELLRADLKHFYHRAAFRKHIGEQHAKKLAVQSIDYGAKVVMFVSGMKVAGWVVKPFGIKGLKQLLVKLAGGVVSMEVTPNVRDALDIHAYDREIQNFDVNHLGSAAVLIQTTRATFEELKQSWLDVLDNTLWDEDRAYPGHYRERLELYEDPIGIL